MRALAAEANLAGDSLRAVVLMNLIDVQGALLDLVTTDPCQEHVDAALANHEAIVALVERVLLPERPGPDTVADEPEEVLRAPE